MENLKIPQHFRFIIPIVEVLKELDGSGKAGEVRDRTCEHEKGILTGFYVGKPCPQFLPFNLLTMN